MFRLETPKKLACTALLAIALLAPAQSADANGLALRPVVEAETVTLGDVFTGLEPDTATIEIASAPEPGRRQVYDMATLTRLAQAHQIGWRPLTRKDHVVITRAHQEVGTTPMLDEIRSELEAVGKEGEVWDISLDNPAARMILALGEDPSVGVNRFQINPRSGRFIATIQNPAVGDPKATITLSGRAHKLVEMPVLARSIRSGEQIAERDIAFETIRESRIPRAAINDASQLIGMSAKRYIRAGMPVTDNQISAPIAVKKGDVVTIRLETPNMVLSARGKALEDGSVGDVIRISNLGSRRLIDAEVTGPEMVRIDAAELASLGR
ncbi:MAG: flagellar basal body P-ring formation chaperone FlgA [Alphaproteobacteria bacterium]